MPEQFTQDTSWKKLLFRKQIRNFRYVCITLDTEKHTISRPLLLLFIFLTPTILNDAKRHCNSSSTKNSNTAFALHTLFRQLPVLFREHVCEDCNWSTPTFYRKIRTRDIVNPKNPKQIISAISKAEKEKIIEIEGKPFEQMGLHISRYNLKKTINNN